MCTRVRFSIFKRIRKQISPLTKFTDDRELLTMATVTESTLFPELTTDDLSRYSRHLILPEVGMEGQRKLKAARVLCVGTGGLGSPLAFYLAAAGVGTLGLVDFDVVDASNLQRQII